MRIVRKAAPLDVAWTDLSYGFLIFFFIDYLPPAGAALPWASSNIQDFIILFYGLCKTIWSPRNQSGAMSAAGEAVEQIIQWKENLTTWVHILFIVHRNFLVWLNAHIHRILVHCMGICRMFWTGAWNFYLYHVLSTYLHLLPFWISVDIANC